MKQRRKNYNAFIVYIFSGFFAFFVNASLAFSDQEWSGTRPPNCKCHSKNRKMVEMHKPFGVKDCLVCHQPSAMEMKGEEKEGKHNKMETARKKKKEDKVCKGCHSVKGDHSELPRNNK
jgi:hypothetical protein